MTMIILALLVTLAIQTSPLPTEPANSAAVEDHLRDIARELPAESALRRNLLKGARGNGTHYPWMDDMRRQRIKRAVVWVNIRFDSKGQPKTMSVNQTQYFALYEGGAPISDNAQLSTIRKTGLEEELNTLALEKARHGYWVDLPGPKPHPFVGETQIEFLDDEWLPAPLAAAYYALPSN
jgi:hypothetical protein